MVAQHCHDDAKLLSLRRLLAATAAAPAAALALATAFTNPACAADIAYVFTPDASITYNDGNTEDVSGGFVFNTISGHITDVSIILTSAVPEAGVYDTVPVGEIVNGVQLIAGSTSLDSSIDISFLEAFGGTTDPFHLFANPLLSFCSPACRVLTTGTAVSGGVKEESTVPEPSTFSLLAAGLGLFGFRRRLFWLDRRRRS
jgi:hypothetical protein